MLKSVTVVEKFGPRHLKNTPFAANLLLYTPVSPLLAIQPSEHVPGVIYFAANPRHHHPSVLIAPYMVQKAKGTHNGVPSQEPF
jgi:hypothetical protein